MSRRYFGDIIPAGSTAINTAGSLNPADCGSLSEFAFYIIGSANISSGNVVIETSHTTSYTGTWANLATGTPSSTAITIVNVTGVFEVLRARISTTIAGGSVEVRAIGDLS